VGELVRTHCEQRVGDEEAALAELTALLRKEVVATRTTVSRNLDETRAILSDLRARRQMDRAKMDPAKMDPAKDMASACSPKQWRRCRPP
jgi:hypothetical protein